MILLVVQTARPMVKLTHGILTSLILKMLDRENLLLVSLAAANFACSLDVVVRS